MAEAKNGGAGGGAAASVSAAAVEELLRSLPGVLHARISVNDWGGVEEVHVLSDSSRHPKSVVRDVESGLAARWSLMVDHKRISVAQLVNVPPRPKWMRVRIQRLGVTSDPVRLQTEVEVTLVPDQPRDIFGRPVHDPEIPHDEWQGRSVGPGAGDLGLRVAALAAVEALNRSLIPGHSFSVDDVARLSVNGREVVVCLAQYRGPRGAHAELSGSALLRGDPLETAVRSVLSATNRLHGVAMRRQYTQHAVGAAWENADMPEWAREAAAAAEELDTAERRGGADGRRAEDPDTVERRGGADGRRAEEWDTAERRGEAQGRRAEEPGTAERRGEAQGRRAEEPDAPQRRGDAQGRRAEPRAPAEGDDPAGGPDPEE